jgi:hypothetical protein
MSPMELLKDVEKHTKRESYNIIRSHKVRKWFLSTATQCKAKIYFTVADSMIGHVIEGSKARYFLPDKNALKKQYAGLVPYLMIEKQLDASEPPEFKRVVSEHEEERKILLAEAEKHRLLDSDSKQLGNEIDELKKDAVERDELMK